MTYLNILAVNGQMGEERFDLVFAHAPWMAHVVKTHIIPYPEKVRPLGTQGIVLSAEHPSDLRRKLERAVVVGSFFLHATSLNQQCSRNNNCAMHYNIIAL